GLVRCRCARGRVRRCRGRRAVPHGSAAAACQQTGDQEDGRPAGAGPCRSWVTHRRMLPSVRESPPVTGDRSMSEEDARTREVAGALTPDTRDRFHIPTAPDGSPAIYLAGQSLGLQPRTAAAGIATELEAWARLGVDAWFDPQRPWFPLDGSLREAMGRIVGARPVEVALLNSLTVDIHLLLASFFRPSGRRRRILADGPLFPSDRHALTSHLAQRGLDPETDLVIVGPREDEA